MSGFDDLGEFEGSLSESVSVGPEDGVFPDTTAIKAVIGRASDLVEPVEEDPEPPGFYRGFALCPAPRSAPASHKRLPDRFYVTSPRGKVGLVPWPGSSVVWPWETGWEQDMHRDIVHSLLKEPKKKDK